MEKTLRAQTDLSRYDNSWYNPGRYFKQIAWYLAGRLFINTYLPYPMRFKVFILRMFGARIDEKVTIKPKVNIKYPWFLAIGEQTWIGEKVWIDNLTTVTLGTNVCLSQGSYILTGNHDFTSAKFDLITNAVVIENGAWIGAFATVCPGVTVGSHAVLAVNSVATRNLDPTAYIRVILLNLSKRETLLIENYHYNCRFNAVKTIDNCIESVLSQNYTELEYIIIDGNSTDGTKDKILSYGDKISRFVSEPDKGIYDAMNKGVQFATGEVIGILNADDFYASQTVLTDISKAIRADNSEGCYGDLVYVDSANEGLVKRKWIAGVYKKNSFLFGWMPPHPTFFLKKECYVKWGNFRLDMGSAADYELMLRMVFKQKITLSYVPQVLVKMRTGGVSNNSLANRWRANRKDKSAWTVNSIQPLFFTLLMKPLRKITQFM